MNCQFRNFEIAIKFWFIAQRCLFGTEIVSDLVSVHHNAIKSSSMFTSRRSRSKNQITFMLLVQNTGIHQPTISIASVWRGVKRSASVRPYSYGISITTQQPHKNYSQSLFRTGQARRAEASNSFGTRNY